LSGEIHRLRIPTPFAVGRVNCYLLTGDPLTLVDTGPNSGTSLDLLERGLAEHGVTIEDLELVVLTHQHMDHEGLLDIVARRSGAEVAAFAPLRPWLAEYSSNAAEDDAFAQRVMRRNGVPDDITTVLGVVASAYRAYGSRGELTRPLRQDDTLTMGGREFTVLERPGHSPSDIVFWEPASELLIGGDHLLGHISSNALITRSLTDEQTGERGRPLLDYIASLQATREMAISEILPGHGDPVPNHRELIDERMRLHERRAAKILRLIEPQALSAHEIAILMWGNVAVTQAYLTLSEVLGHIDLLMREGRVVEIEDDAVLRFCPA